MARIRAQALVAIAVVIAVAGCGSGGSRDRAARTASHRTSAATQVGRPSARRPAVRSSSSYGSEKSSQRRSQAHLAAKGKGPPAVGALAKTRHRRRPVPDAAPTPKALRSLPGAD